jgi:hypothetical protein
MKNRYLVYFVLAELLMGSFFGALIHNAVKAEGELGGVIIGDSVQWENKYAKLVVSPHTSRDIITQVQFANLTWKYSNNVIDVAFRFNDSLVNSGIWKFFNNSWVDIKGAFQHVIYNGKHYYYVQNFNVVQGATYRFKWSYDVSPNTNGKWDLLAKLSSDTIPVALSSGRYVCLDPWWNSSFLYNKVLTISNKCLGYQMKLIIGNNSGGNVSLGGHVKKGYGFLDVRFVNMANTSLYYFWRQNCTNDTQATFFVNNSDNCSQMMLYYGNSASVESGYMDGSKTFYAFSHFNNLIGWTVQSGTWNIKSSSYVEVPDGGTTQYLKRNTTNYFNTNYIIDMRFKLIESIVTTHHTWRQFLLLNSPTPLLRTTGNDICFNTYEDGETNNLVHDNYGAASFSTITDFPRNSWYKGEVRISDAQDSIALWNDTTNYLYGTHTTTNTKDGGDYWGIATGYSHTYIDWIFIRKYCSVVPYFSAFSGEVTNSPPIQVLLYPTNNSIDIPFLPTISVWCNDTDTNLLTVTFYSNYSGSWVLKQTNASFSANNICRMYCSFAVSTGSKYYIRINVTDGVTLVSRYYVFTLHINNTVVFHQNISFSVFLYSNFAFDYTMECNISNATVNGNDVGNGTYTIWLSDPLYGVNYIIYVNQTNLFGNTSNCTFCYCLECDGGTPSLETRNYYNRTESDEMFLGAILNIDSGLLFLLICLTLWVFLVSEYIKNRTSKSRVMYSLLCVAFSIPLAIQLGIIATNYLFGYFMVVLIPIFSVYLFVDSLQKGKK